VEVGSPVADGPDERRGGGEPVVVGLPSRTARMAVVASASAWATNETEIVE
jgi:hypothetical protein